MRGDHPIKDSLGGLQQLDVGTLIAMNAFASLDSAYSDE
jgi:hypothetical protein